MASEISWLGADTPEQPAIVHIGNGEVIASDFTAGFRLVDRDRHSERIVTLHVAIRRGRPIVRQISVATTPQRPESSFIGTLDLRAVQVPALLDMAIAQLRRPATDDDHRWVGPMLDATKLGQEAPQRKGRGYDLEHWRQVARVYAEARAARKNTQTAVVEQLGAADERTAARWIKQARDKGLLTDDGVPVGLTGYFRFGPDDTPAIDSASAEERPRSPFGR